MWLGIVNNGICDGRGIVKGWGGPLIAYLNGRASDFISATIGATEDSDAGNRHRRAEIHFNIVTRAVSVLPELGGGRVPHICLVLEWNYF